jgi:hypothetical protein
VDEMITSNSKENVLLMHLRRQILIQKKETKKSTRCSRKPKENLIERSNYFSLALEMQAKVQS